MTVAMTDKIGLLFLYWLLWRRHRRWRHSRIAPRCVAWSLMPTGAVLRGANVRATQQTTNERRTVTTDEGGRFAVPELPLGSYVVEITLDGYRSPYDTRRAGRRTGAVARRALEPVDRAERRGQRTARPDRSRFGGDGHADRSRDRLPGSRSTAATSSSWRCSRRARRPAPQGSAGSVRGDFAFNVNGAREDANSFLLDGVYNVDPKLSTSGVRPPVDAIREFEVLTSTYDASFGRNAGGQVNVVTRSGTNRVRRHGLRVLPQRGARRDATTSRRPTPATRLQPASVRRLARRADRRAIGRSSSPTTRARGSREGITRVTNVPTAAERTGDFSQSLFARAGQSVHAGSRFRAVRSRVLPEPDRRGDRRALPAAESRRCRSRTSCRRRPCSDDVDQFDVRIDHALRRRLAADGALQLQRPPAVRAVCRPGVLAVPGFGNDVPRRGQNLRGPHARADRLVARQRRALRLHPRGHRRVRREPGSIDNASVGLPSAGDQSAGWGLSLITVAGFSPLGHEYNNPQESASDTFQMRDTRDLDARRAPRQVRRRVVRRAAGGVPRRAGARLPDFHRAGLHRQRARRSAARPAGGHRRRAPRQPAESARAIVEPVRARRLARDRRR